MKDLSFENLYEGEMKRLLWYRRSRDATRKLSVLALAGMAYFAFGQGNRFLSPFQFA